MIETFRNILAFVSIFTVVATSTMVMLNVCFLLLRQRKVLTDREERLIVYVGIVLAIVLIPFYSLPC